MHKQQAPSLWSLWLLTFTRTPNLCTKRTCIHSKHWQSTFRPIKLWKLKINWQFKYAFWKQANKLFICHDINILEDRNSQWQDRHDIRSLLVRKVGKGHETPKHLAEIWTQRAHNHGLIIDQIVPIDYINICTQLLTQSGTQMFAQMIKYDRFNKIPIFQ